MTNLLSRQRAARAVLCLGGAVLSAQFAFAQIPQPTTRTEASPPIDQAAPLDDFVTRRTVAEHAPLAYQPVREADVAWEKRIWRVIDTREKMNLPFIFPQNPLFEIIRKAAENGDLTLYDPADERFTQPFTTDDIAAIFSSTDTVIRFDPITYVEERVVVQNQINWADVHRWRVKEAWFFDKNTGTMNVRILGIAPLMTETTAEGDFKYEKPLFWVHYPTARPLLARQKVYAPGDNMAATMTWEDLFEMRYFASTIYKENNVYDRRLQDYLAGTDLLMEADKIRNEIFNFEEDLWQK